MAGRTPSSVTFAQAEGSILPGASIDFLLEVPSSTFSTPSFPDVNEVSYSGYGPLSLIDCGPTNRSRASPYYDILGAKPDATQLEIKISYHKLAMAADPIKGWEKRARMHDSQLKESVRNFA
jgi:hypothetical protein